MLSLTPLPLSRLPSHPTLPTTISLSEFLPPLLSETQTFLSAIPSTFQKEKLVSSPPSTAKIQLSSYKKHPSPRSERKEEHWFSRRSVHANEPVHGTASFVEFQDGLRYTHSLNEGEYTPSIVNVTALLEWEGCFFDGWKVDLAGTSLVYSITHAFPPLSPRTFVNLVLCATEPDGSGFITVQIPVESSIVTQTQPQPQPESKTVYGVYTSVEHVRLHGTSVEWVMATTSDAKGSIPGWMQRSYLLGGVPKAIIKDVGLFIDWVDRKRITVES
ncbi:hypothetical protein ASPZODRAFT_1250144 [Penicilliopsis zonata CBS 506.65]|uniref:DUF3074 domain-containing protein n=1 Tax=Penicilliopsis zonata CBS 506.65 TaxID=1073090 RepID=A0A1L9S768_9EURO|nr:hypothetical protein ASPZODRAFT_1250144 [Penicilliopsis zonata CBS 506.65]OJJ42988.1 hypothetical protein ASPZODRAFT_1250144 [Penicilliopsis zonata CBS 506.65]